MPRSPRAGGLEVPPWVSPMNVTTMSHHRRARLAIPGGEAIGAGRRARRRLAPRRGMCRGSAEDLRIVACGCALAVLFAAMMAAAAALAEDEDEANQHPRAAHVILEPPLLPPVYFVPAPPPSYVSPFGIAQGVCDRPAAATAASSPPRRAWPNSSSKSSALPAAGPTAPGSRSTRRIGPRGTLSARSFIEETLD